MENTIITKTGLKITHNQLRMIVAGVHASLVANAPKNRDFNAALRRYGLTREQIERAGVSLTAIDEICNKN